MKLRNIFEANSILPELEADSKKEAIQKILEIMPPSIDKNKALEDILLREEDYSTGLEEGIAFPHARTSAVRELQLGFARSTQGINFDSRDKKPSHFIPLLLTPISSGKGHIMVLAEIIRKLETTDIRKKILDAKNKNEIYHLLTE